MRSPSQESNYVSPRELLRRFSGVRKGHASRYDTGSHHPEVESCSIAKLQQLIKDADLPYHKKRLRALLLIALGYSNHDIAADVGYSARHVYNIQDDFWYGGWAGVFKVKGAPLIVDPNAIKDLIKAYLWGTPPENFRFPIGHPNRFKWTGPQVRTFIKKRTGIEIGPKRRDAILKGLEQLRENFTEQQLRIYYGDEAIKLSKPRTRKAEDEQG